MLCLILLYVCLQRVITIVTDQQGVPISTSDNSVVMTMDGTVGESRVQTHNVPSASDFENNKTKAVTVCIAPTPNQLHL